ERHSFNNIEGFNFRHTLTTAFQCYCCHRDYQCNKNDRVDKKERQQREAEFNTTGK
ncbi:hypothetical protein C2G38_2240546, partial [Gigaspora rosea]